MPFFQFLVKDKSWNDTVKINQYLFLQYYFWLIYFEYQCLIPTNDFKDPVRSKAIHDLHRDLSNFSCTLLNTLGFLLPFVNIIGEDGMAMLMTIDTDPKDLDEQVLKILVRKLHIMNNGQPLSWKETHEWINGVRRTYNQMISILDRTGRLLENVLGKDARYSNLMILRIWYELQDSYFREMIGREESNMLPLEKKNLWIHSMDDANLNLLNEKVREITCRFLEDRTVMESSSWLI